MVQYLLRQTIMFSPPGLLGLGVVTIYFVVNQDWVRAAVLAAVAVLGLAQYAVAKYWLRTIEDHDLRQWQRENPSGEPGSRDDQ